VRNVLFEKTCHASQDGQHFYVERFTKMTRRYDFITTPKKVWHAVSSSEKKAYRDVPLPRPYHATSYTTHAFYCQSAFTSETIIDV